MGDMSASASASASFPSGSGRPMSSRAPPAPHKACHQCKSDSEKTFVCIQCNSLSFCDNCWYGWVLHAEGATGWGGRPHEKSDPQVVTRLRQILEPSITQQAHEQELETDDDTTWFGVARDSSNHPVFQDYGRFATLMSDSQAQEPGNRFPQLVSFIGQTGAGKSTLIKILIERALADTKGEFPSPATSCNNDRIPTTGDVHLYADPSTFYTKAPMLYADCEGLNGGETVPKGLRHRTPHRQESGGGIRSSSARPSSRTTIHIEVKNKLKKSRHSSQRDIAWAISPTTKKREYAVTQLYPRLLYTFSDVVVFVLRNPRAFESLVLEKLIKWGAASIDKSLNQPALPHAIICLNATEDVTDQEWDIETATKLLLEDIRGAVFREPQFEEHARIWRESGRTIESTHDLLKCYYASVSVVRIPARGRYMLMDEQVGKLSELTKRKCEASLLNKRRVRMLSTAEKLQTYLQAAYDHFSRDLDTPFDFIREALKHNPIPRDFGGNILKLLLAIKVNMDEAVVRSNAAVLFNKMAPMVASCINLDSIRQNLMGTTVQLLDDAYFEFCHSALKQFSDMYLPCSFSNARGQCCNVRSGHSPKGHQNAKGRPIAPGSYQSAFEPDEFAGQWIEQIRNKLREIQSAFTQKILDHRDTPEASIASEMHLDLINNFYFGLGNVGSFVSHETCFSCLRELPEHPLPCGHVLCLPCVQAYGQKVSPTLIELTRCPLHLRKPVWEPAWQIKIKPPLAGVRILCLDGGGFRGIATLQVLKQMERILGPKLPLQHFFDLIVGTSTGGIIALGLGVQNWSVDTCIRYFKELCGRAFTPREMKGVPGLEQLAILHHGSMYKTRPFEKLLQEVFEQDRPLFGGANDMYYEMPTKVAITSTMSVEQHPVVLANYNRPENAEYEMIYRFKRATGPEKEMKVWEVARATSAAPPYFKPFQKPETRDSYIDGALYHNCPVWVAHHERRLIWGDDGGGLPDLLLSIGTGMSSADANTQTPQTPSSVPPKGKNQKTFLPTQLYQTAHDRFDNILNCRRIWDSFLAENSQRDARPASDAHRRYVRINPDLRMPVPRLDHISSLEDVETAAAEYVKANPLRIKEIVHRLIASTFFFDKEPGPVKMVRDEFQCEGRILCRFVNKSDEMKALGEFLRGCLRGNFEPYFIIQEEENHPSADVMVPLPEAAIHNMYLRGFFRLDRIKITATKELSSIRISMCLQETPYPYSADPYLPISGFPRDLMSEDSDEVPQRKRSIARTSGEFGTKKPPRFSSFRDRSTTRDSDQQGKKTALRHSSTSGGGLRAAYSGLGGNLDSLRPPTPMPGTAAAAAEAAVWESPADVGNWAKRRSETTSVGSSGFDLASTMSREEFIYELEG